jgi:hypothetical protein
MVKKIESRQQSGSLVATFVLRTAACRKLEERNTTGETKMRIERQMAI